MKYVLYLILLVSFTSCSLEKRLAKYCPLCTQKDSTETIIQYKGHNNNYTGRNTLYPRYIILWFSR